MTEEELAVQIRKVDRVEIDNVDLAKAGEDEIFEKLATNTAGTDHENARLKIELAVIIEDMNIEANLFDARKRRAERLPLESLSTHLARDGEPTRTTANEEDT